MRDDVREFKRALILKAAAELFKARASKDQRLKRIGVVVCIVSIVCLYLEHRLQL